MISAEISSIPPSIMGCSSLVEFYMGFYSPLFLIDNIKILVAFGVYGFSST